MRGTSLMCLSKAGKGTFDHKIGVILIICSIYILILHRPEGQDPKQYRILIVEQIKLQNFQWD